MPAMCVASRETKGQHRFTSRLKIVHTDLTKLSVTVSVGLSSELTSEKADETRRESLANKTM